MDWSSYLYLAGVAVAAVALLLLVARLAPVLCKPAEDAQERPRRGAAELAVLGAITVLGVLAIYWRFIFGDLRFGYWDLGSDTLEQYVPYYIDMVNDLKAGTWGAWDFHYGLGVTFMAFDVWAYDPFNVITIPLAMALGTARLGRILVLVQGIKILLAAYMFDHLLTFYCKTPIARVVGGALCGFGGWLLLWGQHYWLGTVYISALLLMLLVELMMERWTAPRFLGLALTTAVSILMGVYSGFMSLLFAAIYALLRAVKVSRCHSLGSYLRFVGPMVASVVCGILAAGVMIVPYANLILNESSRVTNSEGMSMSQRAALYLVSFAPVRWLPLILSRVLGNSLVISGDIFPADIAPYPENLSYLMNSYEFVMVGAGGACLVLTSQATGATMRQGDRRSKVLVLVACVLCVLFCLNFFLPALFSAFGLKYRASFTVGIMLCLGSAVGLDVVLTQRRIFWPEFAVTAVLTLAAIAWSLVRTVNGRLDSLFFLVATVAALALLVALVRLPQGRASRTVVALLCAAVVAMPVVDGFFATNLRGAANVGNFPAATNADKDTRAALDYLRQTDGDFYRVGKVYSDWTRLNDSMVQGYGGIPSYNSLTDSDTIEFFRKEWPAAVPGIVAYQDYSADPFEQNGLNVVGARYVLTQGPVTADWLEPVGQFGNVYAYRNTANPGMLSLSTGYLAESEADAMTVEQRQAALADSIVVPDEVAGSLGGSQAQTLRGFSLRLEGSSHLSGSFQTDADCVALLSVPQTSGWTVAVDGQEVQTFRADYGFIGFKASAGEHTVSAFYRPTGLTAGIAVSAVGVVAAVAICVAHGRRAAAPAGRHAA